MRNLVLGTFIVLGACGPSGRTDNGLSPDASPASPTDGGQQVDTSRVYAHSGKVLYQINAQTLTPVQLGTMSGLGNQSLTDLAVDKDDRMLGITLDKLYEIDPVTGAATLINDLSQNVQNITSLSFVPSDLNDSNSPDILVSVNSFGEVFQIDTTAGTATMLGEYGMVANGRVGSSGDLIGVRGLGIYATVNVGTSPASQDYLARIDPATWTATPIGTGTGFNDIFGLAYWQGTIYGFISMGANAGKIIRIDPNTGVGTEIQSGAIQWYGAGVATDAPILQ